VIEIYPNIDMGNIVQIITNQLMGPVKNAYRRVLRPYVSRKLLQLTAPGPDMNQQIINHADYHVEDPDNVRLILTALGVISFVIIFGFVFPRQR
jgi:hypothetical protein